MPQKAKQWSFRDLSARDQAEMRRLTNDMWKLGAAQIATDTTSNRTTTSTTWVALDASLLSIKEVPVRGRLKATFCGTFQHSVGGVNVSIGIRKGTSGDPLNEHQTHWEVTSADNNGPMHVQALFEDLDPTQEVTIEAVWKTEANTLKASGTHRTLMVEQA